MKKKNREIEIFSLSALDLFASAMGVFVLLTVIMLPYFFKGKEYENEIGQLESAMATANQQAADAKKVLTVKADELAVIVEAKPISMSREQRNLSKKRLETAALASKIEDLKKKIDQEKEALAKRPKVKKKPKKKVTFRFLGLNTDQDRYLILVDGSARMKKFATNLPKILLNTVSVFGPGIEFAIAFYRFTQGTEEYVRWPKSGFSKGGPEARARVREYFKSEYGRMGGGSSTYGALLKAIKEDTESIILISDGFIFPKHNKGLDWQRIVQKVTAQNRAQIEINSVAVGIFFKHTSFAAFLNELSLRNKGDFKAIPP